MVLSVGRKHVYGIHVSGVYLQPGVFNLGEILQDPPSIPIHEVLSQVETQAGSVPALADRVHTQDSHPLTSVLYQKPSLYLHTGCLQSHVPSFQGHMGSSGYLYHSYHHHGYLLC